MLEHYTRDLPPASHTSLTSPPDSPKTVILTGSTGSMGSHLLTNVLANPPIATPPLDRQHTVHETNGLSARFSPESVTFLKTDLSQPYFGLSQPTYKKLLKSVTHILHNAWEFNFNHSIQSVQYLHIHAVRRFINFISQSKYGAFISFISTISSNKLSLLPYGSNVEVHHRRILPTASHGIRRVETRR